MYAINTAKKDKQKLALAYNNQACILAAQDEYGMAIEQYQKAIEMNPNATGYNKQIIDELQKKLGTR